MEDDASGDAKGRLGDAAKEAIKEALVGGWVGGWVEGGIFWLGLSPWEGSFWRFAAAFAAIELSPLQQSSSASWPASPPLPCTLPARLPAARCR